MFPLLVSGRPHSADRIMDIKDRRRSKQDNLTNLDINAVLQATAAVQKQHIIKHQHKKDIDIYNRLEHKSARDKRELDMKDHEYIYQENQREADSKGK